MQDVRFALRTMRKQPIFSLVAILTLTLGIGANTAIFSLLYQVLLRPLPYPAADRLVFIWNTYPLMNLVQAGVSIPDYIDRKTRAGSLEDAALFTSRRVNLAEEGRPEQLNALAVTPTFFTTLGRWPFIGRPFREEEAKPGADRVAILTYSLWSSRFAADRRAIGRQIRLSGDTYEVVGVLPANFELPTRDVSLLVPFAFTDAQMSDQERGREFSSMIARLKPGASLERLNGEMKTIVAQNLERLPERKPFAQTSGFSGYAVRMRDQLVGDVRAPLYVLQLAVVVVLLIACANVANLLLMRANGRRRELALRAALGAGHGRLARQLLTESLLLSLLGGAGGLAVGLLGLRVLLAVSTRQLSLLADASLHPVVLLWTIGLSLVTGLVFGLAPIWPIVREHAAATLKEDHTRGSAGSATGFTRSTLVVTEMALALVLLATAGLLFKSFVNLQRVTPGFSSENVLTGRIALPASRYADFASRRQFWQRLLDEVRAVPGVRTVGLTSTIPLSGDVNSGSYSILGYTPAPNEAQPHGRQEFVGGDYFGALKIPLLQGRLFDSRDGPDSPTVVVVDEYLVKRYFADRSPLGQQIRRGPNAPPFTIVGVVGTINAVDLSAPVTKERLYYSIAQRPEPAMALLVRTALDPQRLVGPIRATVQSIDPEQPIADVRTMDQWILRSLETRRLPMLLLTLFAAVSVLLAGIGLYGVLAFGVAQRAREFGIRQALGADATSIVSIVLAQGLRTTGIGIALGLGGALMVTRYLSSQLFGVASRDAGVFGTVTVLLFFIAVAACYVPALRATRVSPVDMLKEE